MQNITVAELGDRDITLVDVREPDEYAAGHVPGAVNIPLGQLAERLDEVPDGPVDVICLSGGRSLRGAQILEAAGRTEIVNVEGGTKAWVDAGNAVER